MGKTAVLKFVNNAWELKLPDVSLPVEPPLPWRTWEDVVPSRLSRFFVHYHEYLAAALDQETPGRNCPVAEFLRTWTEVYPAPYSPRARDSWHPYVISRRIPVWISLLTREKVPQEILADVLRSLAAQARWLRKNLEFDLGGNHLLQNLRALALAGAFFKGKEADEWLCEVGRLLQRELAAQILPHGEHFERAPSYHVDMLVALADVREAGNKAGLSWEEYLTPVIDKMAEFLAGILHPDGEIPLLSDSAFGLAPSPPEAFVRLGKTLPRLTAEEPCAYTVGTYWVFRDAEHYLIFDAGPVGPDHLPAHVHADLLTIEATWTGKRLFVDAGVFDYEDSAERAFARSTAAHNTLEVDGQNQCDVWGRFRMGRRGWPTALCHGRTGPFFWAKAAHNAYRFLGVRWVHRLVACSPSHGWLIADLAEGSGEHKLASRLRVAPEWHVTVVDERTARLECADQHLEVKAVGAVSWLRSAPVAYFPELGCREQATELVQEWRGRLPAVIGWHVRTPDQSGVTIGWQPGKIVILAGTQAWPIFPGDKTV